MVALNKVCLDNTYKFWGFGEVGRFIKHEMY